MFNPIPKENLLVLYAVLASLTVVGLIIGLAITASALNEESDRKNYNMVENVRMSKLGIYKNAAVSVDAAPCAQIAVDILKQNGTAVDAAIAALVCSGAVNSQSMGLGGGFFMVIHPGGGRGGGGGGSGGLDSGQPSASRRTVFLDAREVAPLAATEDMFTEDPTRSSTQGPHSIAVPGEIKGYFEAKARFGNPKLTMAQLFQPTIDMCRNGIKTSTSLVRALKRREALVRRDPQMSSTFVVNGELVEAGSLHRRPGLASTLETLARDGDRAFYGGDLGKEVVRELSILGSTITMQDLENYRVQWKEPVTVPIRVPGGDRLDVVTSNAPGGGAVVGGLLKVMGMLGCNATTMTQNYCRDDDPQFYGQYVEAMKFAFAQRSHLGDNADPDQAAAVNETLERLKSDEWAQAVVSKIRKASDKTSQDPEFYFMDCSKLRGAAADKGTTHISVVGPNGDAVSATSTINYYFGSVIMSPSSGIIFNNEMDDFSTNPDTPNKYGLVPSETNTIKPGKRPASSMSPTLVFDSSDNLRAVAGASGGPSIISSVAGVLLRHFFLGENVKSAIDYPRLHHQLLPMQLSVEMDLPEKILNHLQVRAGHKIVKNAPFASTYSLGRVQAIFVDPDTSIITANNDYRKNGAVGGF